MPAKVVDASVVAAMVFEEPRAEEAAALVQGEELYAPQLLAYELTHVAVKKSRASPAQQEAFAKALEAGLSLGINWQSIDHAAVMRLALQTGLTAYDASYLYLSRLLGAPLVAFDERLQAAAQLESDR